MFNTLYDIDTSEREQVKETGRTSLNYLPWATVYSEVCKNFDDVKYEFLRQTKEVEEVIHTVVDETTTREKHIRYTEELPYFDTPLGLEVRTRVTINGISKEMNLPVYNASYKGLGSTPYEYDTKTAKQSFRRRGWTMFISRSCVVSQKSEYVGRWSIYVDKGRCCRVGSANE